jgi:RimJ/RimL family protein N-acetyltransferase
MKIHELVTKPKPKPKPVVRIAHMNSNQLHTQIGVHRENRKFWDRIKYVSTQAGEFYITAVVGERIVGVISLQFNPHNPNQVWVMGVSVDPQFQNQGIAGMLVRELFAWASGLNHEISLSSMTDQGKQYLSALIQRLKQEYPSVVVIHSSFD